MKLRSVIIAQKGEKVEIRVGSVGPRQMFLVKLYSFFCALQQVKMGPFHSITTCFGPIF